MSELYIGLIALGITFVIGVFVYNKWQERRYRSLAEKVLNSRHTDVLFDGAEKNTTPLESEHVAKTADILQEQEEGQAFEPPEHSIQEADLPHSQERIEPVINFDEAPAIDEPAQMLPDTRTEEIPPAVVTESVDIPETVKAEKREPQEPSEPVAFLSEHTDYIASLELIESIRASQLILPVQEVLSRLHKPVLWVGYNESTRQWDELDESSPLAYRCIRAGLQLVDRQGAVQESDLSAFHLVMQDLAAQLTAVINMPPRQPALDAAVRLDEFCAGVDIQIGINVISQGAAFQGTKIRALAEAAGMLIDSQGRLVRHDENGHMLYVLLNREIAGFTAENMKSMTTHGLTFLLDVPKVENGERVFDQMLQLAVRFAEVLRGVLVDDNRQPLTPATLEPIRKQIGYFQAMMQERGLPAGNSITTRLFS